MSKKGAKLKFSVRLNRQWKRRLRKLSNLALVTQPTRFQPSDRKLATGEFERADA